MITVMRKYLKGLHILLFAVIAVFIATSVFVWGKGSLGGGPGDGIAVVNGETVPVERYQQRFQAIVARYTQMYPGQFTAEMAERLGLRRQVVNDLVTEALVVQRARSEGLTATDEELNAQIQAAPVFHEGGTFSITRYEEFLRARRTTASAFEAEVRRELTRLKVESAIKSGVRVSDPEIEQTLTYRKEKGRAAWALVALAPVMAVTTASDAEIDAYLKEHRAQFERPERRRVQYVAIDSQEWVTTPIPEAEIEKYYKEHPAEFETPRQVLLAHVLARVGETGGSEAEAKARAKVEEAIRRANAGEDFGKVARELSEDSTSASKGGEIGWIAKGQVVPSVEAAAFALKKGEIAAEPVRTQFGYHAIKTLDIREGTRKPLKEAMAEIRAKLLTEHIEKGVSGKADRVRPALRAAKDFAAEAKRLGLEPRESTINRSGPKAPDRNDVVQDAAFSLAVGGVSEPLKTPGGRIILKVLEHLPAAVPPLAEIKTEVADAVKRAKADGVAAERAKKLVEAARTGDLLALARKEGFETGESAPFSRTQPAAGLPREAVLAALQLPVGGTSEPVKTPQGYYVVKTLERTPPDAADLARDREQTARELLEAKRNRVWEKWLAGAQEQSKIELNDQFESES
jgi:peptidyl-prolyl cis-trans isomerase D